jgi:2-haloacid dehalogenase
MDDSRWATFDCYGTLVDWNAGIGAELDRMFGSSQGRLLRRYHQIEPRVQQEHPTCRQDRHVHVAQSHFHDIVPANQLGIRSVWINRLGETGDPAPTRELPDLTGLGDVLDELVPAVPRQPRGR